MGVPSMPELIIILVIVMLLFGAKKIPDLAQGIGKGIKNFKKAMNEDDEKKPEVEKEEVITKTEAKPETQTTQTTKSDT